MRIAGLLLLAAAVLLHAQSTARARIDEAFRLAGVAEVLASLPTYINEMAAPSVAQTKVKDADAFARELKSYFIDRYDASKMATFLALERTPTYRTMHRMEAAADKAPRASRRSFEANLKSDPPGAKRVALLKRLDAAMSSTGLQIRIATEVLKGLPAGPPSLANSESIHDLFVYRNVDDSELEDYVVASEHPAVQWFNHTLQAAILVAMADRPAIEGENTNKPPVNP